MVNGAADFEGRPLPVAGSIEAGAFVVVVIAIPIDAISRRLAALAASKCCCRSRKTFGPSCATQTNLF